MRKPPPPRARQPICPDCRTREKRPGSGLCNECKVIRNRNWRARVRDRRPILTLVLSGKERVCFFCKTKLPIECFVGTRNECKACRSERRGELEHGAARCKPWQRKGLRKAVG